MSAYLSISIILPPNLPSWLELICQRLSTNDPSLQSVELPRGLGDIFTHEVAPVRRVVFQGSSLSSRSSFDRHTVCWKRFQQTLSPSQAKPFSRKTLSCQQRIAAE